MRLIADLEASVADDDSFFRTQLVKEDVARLRTLQSLVASTDSSIRSFAVLGDAGGVVLQ